MNGQRSGLGKSAANALFDLARTEYKRVADKDVTKQGLMAEMDLLIENVKAVDSLNKDQANFLLDFFKHIKRDFMGLNYNPSDKDIAKAVEIIKKIVGLGVTAKEETDKLGFWADTLTLLSENRKKESRATWR